MPMINVASVLTSPMLMDTFAVNRRTQVVSGFGIASTTSQPFNGLSGVVYPSNENELKRLPDTQVQSKAITVITRFALRGEAQVSGTEFQPDIVVWNGNSFLVRDVQDWGRYAAGFVNAICTSIDLVDQPPVTE
jgi:galactose-6-phosphate isomerase